LAVDVLRSTPMTGASSSAIECATGYPAGAISSSDVSQVGAKSSGGRGADLRQSVVVPPLPLPITPEIQRRTAQSETMPSSSSRTCAPSSSSRTCASSSGWRASSSRGNTDSGGERSWRVVEEELESRWQQPEPEPSRRSVPEEKTQTQEDLEQRALLSTPPRFGRGASLTEMRRLAFGEVSVDSPFSPKSAVKSAARSGVHDLELSRSSCGSGASLTTDMEELSQSSSSGSFRLESELRLDASGLAVGTTVIDETLAAMSARQCASATEIRERAAAAAVAAFSAVTATTAVAAAAAAGMHATATITGMQEASMEYNTSAMDVLAGEKSALAAEGASERQVSRRWRPVAMAVSMALQEVRQAQAAGTVA